MFDAVTVALFAATAGVVTALVAHRLRLSVWRQVAATSAVIALTVMLATEQDGNVGDWWARHPTSAAVVTGVLLLTLTVLIIETAVARSLARAEERRWRPAGAVAAGSVLDAVAAYMKPQQKAIWEHSAIASDYEADRTAGLDRMGQAAAGFGEEIRRAMLDPAPVLTATPGLYEIYRPALDSVQAAARYEAEMDLWAQAARLPHDPTSGFSADDAEIHDHWWDVVAGAWTEFRDVVAEFARRAETELGARRTGWDLAPWSDNGPEDYRDRLSLEIERRQPTEADYM